MTAPGFIRLGTTPTRRWSRVLATEVTRERQYPIVRCDGCGREVHCTSFTNTCECGADYGSSGWRLAPREQWGEETGEQASDVLVSEDALVASLDGGAR